VLISLAVAAAGLLPHAASAAISDCEGMSFDGMAKCIAPTYPQTSHNVCDIGPAYMQKIVAWNSCAAELNLPSPLTEAAAVQWADCWDKKMAGPTAGVTGSVPWLPIGSGYYDGSCVGGTVHGPEGHMVWGVGNLSGKAAKFAFWKESPPVCPAGYSPVSMTLRGINEVVRCKPAPPCPPDQVQSPSRANVCDTVANVSPPFCEECAKLGNPIYPLTGAKREVIDTGLSLNGLAFTLTYQTTGTLSGSSSYGIPSFGKLWTSSLHRSLLVSTNASVITANRGDGRAITFTWNGSGYVAASYEVDRLTSANGNYYYVDARNNRVESYTGGGRLTRIDFTDGRSLSFTYTTSTVAVGAGYLARVTDNTGRSLSLQYKLVPGSEVLVATRGYISAVIDSAGRQMQFGYDANSNLATIAWPNNKQHQLLYEQADLPWAMTGRVDETGTRIATWGYDSGGRAVSTSGANGANAYTVNYATPPDYTTYETEDTVNNILYRRRAVIAPTGITITLPNGQTVAWGATDIQGAPRLASVAQAAGSGSAESQRASTFDASGNLTSSDDFAGVRTCYAYDSANREVTRVEGLANTVLCTAVLPANAVLPAGARKVATAWHPDWRLPKQVVQPLRTATYVYHGQADPFNGNATANCTPAPGMPHGKPLPLLCKHVEQATLPSGAPDTSAPASVDSFTYNASGRVLSSVSNTLTTTYAYFTSTAFPATSSDPHIANVVLLAHGDGADGAIWATDSSLAQQTLTFAGEGRISSVQSKFGGASMSFDGSGDYLTIENPAELNFGGGDFTVEGWFYLSEATNSWRYLLNAPFGTFPPGGSLSIRFGDNGWGGNLYFGTNWCCAAFMHAVAFTQAQAAGAWHHIAWSKQAGINRAFVDGALLSSWTDGQGIDGITAATISSGGTTAWVGFIDDLRITKGVGRYTGTFTPPAQAFANPDLSLPGRAVGDLQSVTNPAGQVTQYTQYDRAGRVRQAVDPKGIVTDTTYTARGKPASVTVTPPGGTPRVTTYIYNDADLLSGVTQPDGTTLSYTYDSARRLTGLRDAQGNSVTYTLDASGNRINEEIRDSGGALRRSVARAYDALNRLQMVTGAAQ
jgi:YD repeat-containing protein